MLPIKRGQKFNFQWSTFFIGWFFVNLLLNQDDIDLLVTLQKKLHDQNLLFNNMSYRSYLNAELFYLITLVVNNGLSLFI